MYECSSDGKSITKSTYDTDDCSSTATETETYTTSDRKEQGELGDFNCVGKTNAVGYDVMLFNCDSSLGIAYLATDVCYRYINRTNVTNDVYPNVPTTEKFQLSQRYIDNVFK